MGASEVRLEGVKRSVRPSETQYADKPEGVWIRIVGGWESVVVWRKSWSAAGVCVRVLIKAKVKVGLLVVLL